MSRIISTNGGAFGAQVLINNEEDRLQCWSLTLRVSQHLQNVSGQDAFWDRSELMFAGGMGFGGMLGTGNLASYGADWDPAPYQAFAGGIGQRRQGLVGVTRNSSGAALASCTVYAFDLTTLVNTDVVISDANGNYTVTTPFDGAAMFIRTYNASGPVWGSSANLTPS